MTNNHNRTTEMTQGQVQALAKANNMVKVIVEVRNKEIQEKEKFLMKSMQESKFFKIDKIVTKHVLLKK